MDFLKAVLRNSMLGLCSAIARVGGIVSPWVAVYLPAQVFTPPLIQLKAPLLKSCSQGERYAGVSLYIFGASSAVAGLLAALYLTESLGSPLPDTLEVFTKPILTFIFVISLSRIWRG